MKKLHDEQGRKPKVGQPILAAAGVLAGFPIRRKPIAIPAEAAQKGGCSQDWLPHGVRS